MQAKCWLALLLLLGCGRSGHAAQPLTSSVAGQSNLDEAGRAGAAPASGGTPSSEGGAPTNEGGTPNSAGETQQGGAAAVTAPQGSAAGASDGGHLRDGTRYCETEQDCLGFDCIGFTSAHTSICSTSCESTAGCAIGELCIGVGELPPLCLQPCQASEDCGYAFDCVHYQDIATFCLPAPWTEQFMHPMP